MVPIVSLILPILLAAVVVFVASSIVHMVLPYHKTDFARLPDEDAVHTALADIPPGDYVLPWGGASEVRKSPEYQEKMSRGPVIFMSILPGGQPALGKALGQWFVFSLVVSLFAGYIASRGLGEGTNYLDVFQITSATAFIGYTLALWPGSIWYGRSWSTTLKWTADGLIYALLTGGVFGWLWPA